MSMRRFAMAGLLLVAVLTALVAGGCSPSKPAAKATIYYFYSPT